MNLRRPLTRIIVVDDFEPLRRFVCRTLEQRSEFQVIGEAADGLEAIQKVRELQPDLILLDISLPKMNGIEAARQIRKLVPKSKILFVTEHNDREIAEVALRTGAAGYLVKSNAANELLEALEVIMGGGQFVSRGIGLDFGDAKGAGVTDSVAEFGGPAPPLQELEIGHLHEIEFYSGESGFPDTFTDIIAPILTGGNAVIVIATPPHRQGLYSKLEACGVDISSAIEHGNYIALDVTETLSTFMVNDLPDPVQLSKAVDDLLVRAGKAEKGEHFRIVACGECAPVLWAQGKAEEAIRLERLWDEIAKKRGVDILCAYPLTDFNDNEGGQIFQRICAVHTAVHSRSEGKQEKRWNSLGRFFRTTA